MQLDNFNFYFNTRICFGPGCRNQLSRILMQHAWKHIGVVVDHNLFSVPAIGKLFEEVQAASEKAVIVPCTISEPTYDSLEEARDDFMDQDLQAIIGIGGGSALDMAKAIAVLAKNRKPAIHYRGFDRMTEPVLPIIAIPTTAGTGSEITPNASFIDSKENRKMGINGEAVRPHYGLLDPELTLSCPESPTVSAGADSIVHAVEAYVARKTNPLARLFAREGFGKVFNYLPGVVREPDNIAFRTEVQYGAFLAAVALMNSGTGPAAAMSYPLGVHFKVPHGIGGALFLPYVAKYNIESGVTDYADLYEVMAGADVGMPGEQKAQQFHEKLVGLWRQLKIDANLASSGYRNSFTNRFVIETMQLKPALDQNPVPFYETEIRELLEQLSDNV